MNKWWMPLLAAALALLTGCGTPYATVPDASGRPVMLLGPAGVNPAHGAVIVSEGGLKEISALAFLALHRLDQKKVSILMDSVDERGLRGMPLNKEPTAVGPKKSAQDMSIVPTAYAAGPRPGAVIADPRASQGLYAKDIWKVLVTRCPASGTHALRPARFEQGGAALTPP